MTALSRICPICRARQVDRPATGRPRKTCSAACAAEFRRLRQFMGRSLARAREGHLVASQAAEQMPHAIRSQLAALGAELEASTAAELLDQRLREGWILGRLVLE